jgi:hypothetical protein
LKERNILAGFRTMEEAEKAAEQLRNAGFNTVQIDTVGQFPGDGIQQINNPISGEVPSLGYLTLAADFPNARDASVLAAASPNASGMADRDNDNLNSNVLLTAVVPENRGDEATHLIRSCGGMV